MNKAAKYSAILLICVFFAALVIGIVLIPKKPHADTPDLPDITMPRSVATEATEVPHIPGVPDNTLTPVTEPTLPPEASVSESGDPLPQVSDDTAAVEPETKDDPDLPEEPEIIPTKEARICIGGDTSLDSEFADAANKWGVDYAWREIAPVFSSADLAIVNLETCVSDRGVSEKKPGYGFRTPPEMLEGFLSAGIDLVDLANNHTRDFGYDALLDTFDHLENYGIDYFGAGRDLDRAGGVVIKEINGLKIGFVGCNYVSLSASCAAAEDHAGINMVYKMNDERTAEFLERVKEYDSMCDVLIAFMHCGIEEVFDVNTYQKNLSRALIDCGADIVVGGHSHTLQPIEFYNDKLIIYSIGNLIFWHIDDDIDGLTAIFDLAIDENGFKSLKLHPVFIKNYKAYYLKPGEGKFASRYDQIIDLMNELCLPYGLQLDRDGYLVTGSEMSVE